MLAINREKVVVTKVLGAISNCECEYRKKFWIKFFLHMQTLIES